MSTQGTDKSILGSIRENNAVNQEIRDKVEDIESSGGNVASFRSAYEATGDEVKGKNTDPKQVSGKQQEKGSEFSQNITKDDY